MVLSTEREVLETALAAVALFLGAAAQAATGFGLGLIAIPLLSLVMPPATAVALGVLLPIPLNAFILVETGLPRSSIRIAHLLVASLLALPVGVFLVAILRPAAFQIAIGLTTLLLSALVLSGRSFVARDSVGTDWAIGIASGIASGATGMGGPLLGIVLLPRVTDKASFRGILLLYLLVLSASTFVALALMTDALTAIVPWLAISVPALVAGLIVGRVTFRRLSASALRLLVLALASAAGAVSLAYGVSKLVR